MKRGKTPQVVSAGLARYSVKVVVHNVILRYKPGGTTEILFVPVVDEEIFV